MSKNHYQMLTINKSKNTDEEVGYCSYLKQEQMVNQQALQEHFWKVFEEGNIDFPPTYKLGKVLLK